MDNFLLKRLLIFPVVKLELNPVTTYSLRPVLDHNEAALAGLTLVVLQWSGARSGQQAQITEENDAWQSRFPSAQATCAAYTVAFV